MKSQGRLRIWLWLVSFLLIMGSAFAQRPRPDPKHAYAYATMLYMGTPRDYDFYVAARVMMRSLRNLNVNADLVVIAANDVPLLWRTTLYEDGAKIMSVGNIESPYKNQSGFDERFALSLNKLYAWNLVEYERVVMLDADNLFLRNTDELFQCGQFCAAFINPCIFHTGLFVLKPSGEIFRDIMHKLATGLVNEDGADQGFIGAYFHDLLDRPMFHPPANGSMLNGFYRLPLGYQMDASYYYLKLSWDIPCGPNSVITFPGALWLKPWYWWAWPVLPLGLSWHNQRIQTIGYGEETPVAIAAAIFYLIIAVAVFTKSSFHSQNFSIRLYYLRENLGYSLYSVLSKTLVLSCIATSYLFPFVIVPKTIHPLMGWVLYLLGSLFLLLLTIQMFDAPRLALLSIWIGIFGVLLVMAFPLYSNGILRALSVAAYAVFAAPFSWWSLLTLLAFLDKFTQEEYEHKPQLPKLS